MTNAMPHYQWEPLNRLSPQLQGYLAGRLPLDFTTMEGVEQFRQFAEELIGLGVEGHASAPSRGDSAEVAFYQVAERIPQLSLRSEQLEEEARGEYSRVTVEFVSRVINDTTATAPHLIARGKLLLLESYRRMALSESAAKAGAAREGKEYSPLRRLVELAVADLGRDPAPTLAAALSRIESQEFSVKHADILTNQIGIKSGSLSVIERKNQRGRKELTLSFQWIGEKADTIRSGESLRRFLDDAVKRSGEVAPAAENPAEDEGPGRAG